MQLRGTKLTTASWCSQRLWMMHRQLVFSSSEGKETTPPFGRWAWEFESSDHDYMAYRWERKDLLVDMVNQGIWAKTSVLSSMSHVHPIWTSRVPEIITSWHPSETAQPISATLALEKNPLCSLSAEWEQWHSLPCQDVHTQTEAEVLRQCEGCTKQEIPPQALGSQKPPDSTIHLR